MTTARAAHAPAGDVLSQPNTFDTTDHRSGSKSRPGPSARKCRICGANLEGRKTSARFCSGKCRAAASRISKAQDFNGLLQRMWRAEQALHAAADDLAEYRVAIEVKIGNAVQ
jgi:hypothetical protein